MIVCIIYTSCFLICFFLMECLNYPGCCWSVRRIQISCTQWDLSRYDILVLHVIDNKVHILEVVKLKLKYARKKIMISMIIIWRNVTQMHHLRFFLICVWWNKLVWRRKYYEIWMKFSCTNKLLSVLKENERKIRIFFPNICWN